MLVITSEINAGAPGVVHGGTLELEFASQSAFVAKLAFSDCQKERLAHENAIYQFLRSKDVLGIPKILGLLNSLDGGPSALLSPNDYNGVSISCFLTCYLLIPI